VEDKEGYMPLYVSTLACEGMRKEECLQVFNLLLNAGADVNQAGTMGWTALHRVAERGNVQLLEALLAVGANPDAKNISGNTPLHIATAVRSVPNIKVLLAGKASMDVRDLEWKSPFQCAFESVVPGVLKAFLGGGAVSKVKASDVENAVTGTMAKHCRKEVIDPLDYLEVKPEESDIVTVLHLLYEASLLSGATLKRMLAYMKRDIDLLTPLKATARTSAQLAMHEHTTAAYATLGLPSSLQRYMAYEEE
jgi:hypothetical protein